MDTKELIGKALMPTALVVVAVIGSSSLQVLSNAVRQASQNAVTATVNADAAAQKIAKAGDTAAGLALQAPAIAGQAAEAAGEGGVKGVANGVTQVVASVALAPVTVPAQIVNEVARPIISEPDRKNIEKVLDVPHWKL